MEEKRFALLIDSDNVSAKYFSGIIGELTKYGVVTYKRIYGDWTSTQAGKWRDILLENSLIPMQQFSNTIGKNATDSALIIDAMDILYSRNVEGFCIVSSDSDFTRLASRLRESGMEVVGMGEKKTPPSFRTACSVFTLLEVLLETDEDVPETTKKAAGRSVDPMEPKKPVIDKKTVADAIAGIINDNENKGKSTELSEVGSSLRKRYSDFDVRNYGYSSLSKFVEEMPAFALVKENSVVTVVIKGKEVDFKQAMLEIVKNSGGELDLSKAASELKKKYPEFKVKSCGYSTFAKFVQSIGGLELASHKSGVKTVICKKRG